MTSGEFSLIPIDSISVYREGRQRSDLEDISDLAESIRNVGLINPIVVTRDHDLVAGERRYTACKSLGFTSIAAQYVEDLDPLTLHLIELEENIKRVDLPWQDEVAAVAEYHAIKSKEAPDWTQTKTGEALGMKQSTVAGYLMVDRAIKDGVEEVKNAPQFSTAKNFAARRQERQKTAVLREIKDPEPVSITDDPDLEPPVPEPNRYASIQIADFTKWAREPQPEPFNVIHCDFPYGINAGNKIGQSAAKSFGGYEDSPEDYIRLLDTLTRYQENFIAQHAHMIFWFSMRFYAPTVEALENAGWRVDPFPLIWGKSDNSGIIPDPNRGPRRTYETALFCTRGDRKIVKARANYVAGAATKTYHMSEKPKPILDHFFRMIVDETASVLDPTCGSGNAIQVAESLGASWSLGLEINPEYAEMARTNLELKS